MFRKNTASQFIHFQGVDASTGGIKTGVSWTVRRCIDGTFAAATGTVTEDGTTGWYKFAMSQADTNGNNIAFNFTGTGAIPQTVNIVTTAADPTDGVRLGLTALPNAAAEAAGGLFTRGTGAGQINQAANGQVDARLVAGDSTASIALKQLNIVNSAGDAIIASSSGSNGHGINASGNGSGHGVKATGGVTGNGLLATGGATSGDGLKAVATTSGHGISATGVGTTKHGINAAGGATSSDGIRATGGGSGSGVIAIGGSTGPGGNFIGNGNANGLQAAGTGTGHGLYGEGGATGNGMLLFGGFTSGHGLYALGQTSGHGMLCESNGSSKHGIYAIGGTSGTSDGIRAVAGTGGVDLRANITGNLSGSVGSLTTNNDKTGYELSSAGVTAIWAEVMTGTVTAVQAMRGFIAALLGKSSGHPGSPVYRNVADSKDVITATTDSNGNRSAVTLDLS